MSSSSSSSPKPSGINAAVVGIDVVAVAADGIAPTLPMPKPKEGVLVGMMVVASGFAEAAAVAVAVVPKGELAADVVCCVAHNPVVGGDANLLGRVFGVGCFGFGFGLVLGGPPNPIEAKISSSAAPIRFFFFGFCTATEGFFFGPRLVMPIGIVVPPIVPGISFDRCCGCIIVGVLIGCGWLAKEVAEMDDPDDIARGVLLIPIPLLLLLTLLLMVLLLPLDGADLETILVGERDRNDELMAIVSFFS